jgi:predicted enzyme related to lactoylglutathione lyase
MSKPPRFGFAIEYVNDIETAKKFYTDVVGLTVERQHPTFVQFSSFAIASDASMTGSRDTELYWLVDDAEASFRALSAKGKGEVSLPLTDKPFGKVFGIRDPDGQPRYFVELAKNRPSQAV